jgi:hypothetical protein
MHATLSDHPVYRKALDIFNISSRISGYLNQDLAGIGPNGSEDELIYFSGDIVQQSYCLAPEIMKAEANKYSEDKYKHMESLERLYFRLMKNCKRLERSNSNGRDFLPMLRTELRKFRELQRHWMLTL